MRLVGISFFLLLLSVLSVRAQTSKLVTGEGIAGGFRRYENFASRFVDARNIDVWLPPDYEKNKNKKYAVLYMHDGQNLFNPKEAFGGADWGVDETLTRLIAEKRVRPAIVVGVWNTPKRYAEYFPQKAVKFSETKKLSNTYGQENQRIISDDYLKFIVEELKPFIDKNYSTAANLKNTFIMGSSMGGLISAYAVSEYPQIFGGAGCVSTHWIAADGAVIEYLRKNLPAAKNHKFYFDFGTETLDSKYEPFQNKMDEVMRAKGYVAGKNWVTRKFVGAEHSEKSWRERVDDPLTFLLGR
jgi:predicted alpha/beta superfamily hydrolase